MLAAHVALGVGVAHRAKDRVLGVLERRRVVAGGGLHRRDRDDLHQVVDDDVAQRADGVVEVAAVGDAEPLGHRDLHAADVAAVPQRLDHRVGESQVQQLVDPHLPEEVVDPVQLRLVEVRADLGVERAGRREVVPERLLDDDAPVAHEIGAGELRDHRAEQRRRDLEVVDRRAGGADRLADLGVDPVVAEVAADVRQALGEAIEDLVVDRLLVGLDRLARPLAQVVDGPVAGRDPDDRAIQQLALLEPVQRVERHHLGEVAGDAEDDEYVGGRRGHGGVVSCRRAPRITRGG